MAGKRSSFAFWTSFSSWAAPSRRLYSEWTCRWTKSECCTAARLAPLLPLDGGRGLRGDVEDHPVHAVHLVDDAIGDPAQQIVRQPRPVGGHRVLTHHGAKGHDVGVGAKV